MFYRAAADGVLLFHLAFIGFALLGALLVTRWRWLVVLHLPAAAWACFIEFSGGICPLTYAENYLRRRGGEPGYSHGFIEHYLTAIIYPAGLTRNIQIVIAAVVVALNLTIYGSLLLRRHKVRQR